MSSGVAGVVEVAFYGDDFTGSTDALAQYTRLGLRGVLLVTMPPPAELRALAQEYDVIGVAGIARSLAPSEQEAEIRPILSALRDLGPRFVQYKVCSTADSSPTLGSLGRALEVGRSLFGPAVVPILVAQPELGRYTAFSHHFAAEAGTVHRLDRQPTMSTHPATPMHESDLRLHLARQTDLRLGAAHLPSYAELPTHYAQSTDDALILDALTDDDLHTIGRTILAAASPTPTFAIGSGGLSRALATALTTPPPGDDHPTLVPPTTYNHTAKPPPAAHSHSTPPPAAHPHTAAPTPAAHPHTTAPTPAPSARDHTAAPARAEHSDLAVHDPIAGQTLAEKSDRLAVQVLVVSGSQSPRTAEQIAHAVASGWCALTLKDPSAAALAAARALNGGAPGVVVHTGNATERPSTELLATLSHHLAAVVHEVVRTTQVRRVLIAGGDTSGRVLRNLGINALELSPTPTHLGHGLTLCTAITPDPHLNGLHFLLKGGQLGPPNLFNTLRHP